MGSDPEVSQEHPVVQQFWASFDYLNSKVLYGDGGTTPTTVEHVINHSNNYETEIAVNLVHFGQLCREHKIEVIDDKLLRRHLITSRKRQYLRNEPIRSRLESRTIRCWIFKR